MPEKKQDVAEETTEESTLAFTVDTDALRDLTLEEWATLQEPKSPWDLIDLLARLTSRLDVPKLKVREMSAVTSALGDEMKVLTEGN